MINCPWCGERIKIPELDYNLYLENINELQNKIDKAIEYINKHTDNGMFELRSDTNEIEELLNILRGEDNE